MNAMEQTHAIRKQLALILSATTLAFAIVDILVMVLFVMILTNVSMIPALIEPLVPTIMVHSHVLASTPTMEMKRMNALVRNEPRK